MLIKKEIEDSLNSLSNDDNFVICSLYGIKIKKITQKNLAKIFNCTQSCIAKKHNKILNLIKENLKYYNQLLFLLLKITGKITGKLKIRFFKIQELNSEEKQGK